MIPLKNYAYAWLRNFGTSLLIFFESVESTLMAKKQWKTGKKVWEHLILFQSKVSMIKKL